MKKKIVILGSTGSIGKKTFQIIKKNKKKFEVILLTTNSNHKEIIKQAKELKVKNIIITSRKSYEIALKNKIKCKIKIYNDFRYLNKIFKKKSRLYYERNKWNGWIKANYLMHKVYQDHCDS